MGNKTEKTEITSRSSLLRKRILLLGLVISLLGIIAWYGAQQIRIYFENKNQPTVTIPSAREYSRSHLEELLAKPVKQDASTEARVKYYDELRFAYAENAQYAKAAEYFNKRESLSTDDLTYIDYMVAAKYFHEAGNSAQALTALDKAERLVPADNYEEAFSRSEAIETIHTLKAEYTK